MKKPNRNRKRRTPVPGLAEHIAGFKFCDTIEKGKWRSALSVFRKIEKRTAKLLKEVA